MNSAPFSWELFTQMPIVGIIRNVVVADIQQILPIYREAGLTTIEITMNTPGAEQVIQYAREHYSEGLNIGAGTVCTTDDLTKALDAGAQFIVTPILDKKVIKTCVKANVPIFPGALTPSEVYKAWKLGASMVKVFPTTALGPGYIKDLKAPLNQIKLVPTGGVDLKNMDDFLKAGADGLGIGSHLFDKTLIAKKDWAGLKTHFQEFAQQLRSS
ncbi:bifunctional 4-hydroxy-2-oxoglutarate aldolase/2-dehydro-3-deoxy-phosphogluconate aldolase [Spirosoma sp. BT702]|uniref:Bifunctional 4-hydroxy-2-oxoglutarate aldolase/2-dehydro-3-deoxy-phosphogluconate aldolase n=1 Tax=Spirosoma profusum TaxID=2771354 RepID=A0A926Y3C4_9BACT|nr:bifunctional 4-hydroxy-2-oxoglutarate aldolase/2-dehydro-3-deoxy-phosphogluconate aldolase [Spirosoma profusum]MBD2701735.1 bifunctional 4-hydroxy-2-oxoglutarate aldolase/2-dehydro-3-deoxy-phosphogluconate aldolase [Spirosoma profusum]